MDDDTISGDTTPRLHSRTHNHLDVVAATSFIGAGIFGIGKILNNIRQSFHNTFVMGYGETRTPFSSILEKYNGTHGMPNRRDPSTWGEFDKITYAEERGEITPQQYVEQRDVLRKEFRKDINTKLMKEYAIPTENAFKDWTVGTWKRWRMMGGTSRIEASVGFASLTAISIGAVALLRHNKRTLDHVEDRIDGLGERGR